MPRYANESSPKGGCAIAVAVLVFIALAIFGIYQIIGWETIDAGNVGIVVNYRKGTAEGKPSITTYYPGRWFWVSPTTEKKYQYPISEQTISLIRNGDNGGVKIQDNSGNGMFVDVSMYWAVDQTHVTDLFLLRPNMKLVDGGGADIETQIVQRELVKATGDAAGQFRYDEIFGKKRGEYNAEVEKRVREGLSGLYINVNRVVIGTVHPNEQQVKNIQANSDAEQAAVRASFLQQQRENEANAAVAEAEGKKLVAQREAEAQANTIKTVNNALASSPDYLKWLIVNRWDGHQPNTLVLGADGKYQLVTPIP